jgi:hypothetical protein
MDSASERLSRMSVPTVYSLTFRKVEQGEAELSWPAAARQAGYFLQGSDSLTRRNGMTSVTSNPRAAK